MEDFINACLAAERKFLAGIQDGKKPTEAKATWCEDMWKARNFLPADPQQMAQQGLTTLQEIERKKWAKIKPIADVPDAQKSAERKAMEAAGYLPAHGPNADCITICRKEGELLRPMAHYFHGKSQWWNLLNPPRDMKTRQGRGMAELLKILKEIK